MIHRFVPYVWKNVWRNRRRSVLTALGVAVAIFVYAALSSAIEGITFPIREVGESSLLNVREAGRSNVLASRLPVGYEQRVEAIDGVGAATGVLNELAVVGANRVHIFVRGIDPDRYRAVQKLQIAPDAWEALRTQRNAALVGYRLLDRMGWRVGSDVDIEMLSLSVHIAGVIPAQGVDLESHMLVRRDYLQAARSAEGEITYVLVAPAAGVSPQRLATTIDRALAHSPVPTQTSSAEGYAEAIVEDFLGFVGYLRIMGFLAILITVVAAANAIAMSVRDRTREIGMLKAIGFRPRLVLFMVLAESTTLSVLGGAVGVVAAYFVIGSDAAAMAGLMLSPSTVVIAALLSFVIGFLGGLVPAVAAARLRTLDALRVVG